MYITYGTTIYESVHPYANNLDILQKVEIAGAIGYYMRFDILSASAGSSDYVSLFKDESCTAMWGSPYFTGPGGTISAWNPLGTLTIYDSTFVIHFKTDPGFNEWGFKLYIEPILQGPIPTPAQLQIDSPHDYADVSELLIPVSLPNAIGYYVRFDSKSATTSCKHYVSLCKDETCTTMWGSPYFTGSAGTVSTWNPTQNLTIYSSSFVIHFSTNGGYTAWGI